MATSRRIYSDRFKAKALQLATEIGPEAAARKLNITSNAIYNWKSRNANGNGSSSPLPVTAEATKVKPKPLTPITFACPHCGKPVVLPK